MGDQRRGDKDGEESSVADREQGRRTTATFRVALDGGLVISMPLGGQVKTREIQGDVEGLPCAAV